MSCRIVVHPFVVRTEHPEFGTLWLEYSEKDDPRRDLAAEANCVVVVAIGDGFDSAAGVVVEG